MEDLHFASVRELRQKLDAGEVSSVELVQALEQRILAVNDRLNAYLSRDLEDALKQAEAADARLAAGERGPLLGIPVALKDLLNVKGQSCGCASKILEGYSSPYDAGAVEKLREAGAVLFGRCNMDEFAMGGSTENSAYGPSYNPWNLEHVPGGSSGGSAAAVSAGAAWLSLGSDTGGSVRQPASFCGCVGLKPSYGRISRYGLTAFASSFDQIGIFSRSVADAADSLGVIAGYDPRDSSSAEESVPDYAAALGESLAGMKIGVAEEFFAEGVDPEVSASVRAAIDACVELGAEVVPVSFPHLEYAVSIYYILAPAEASANLARFDGIRYGNRVEAEDPVSLMRQTRDAHFGDEVKRRILLGTYVLSSGYYDAYYLKAQKARALLAKDFEDVFSKCDVLATPVSPSTAFAVGKESKDPLNLYLADIFTIPANLSGACGISVPCGFSEDGLPIGVQFLGPAFGEEQILKVGHAYEQAHPQTLRPTL